MLHYKCIKILLISLLTEIYTFQENNNHNNYNISLHNKSFTDKKIQFRVCGAYCGPGWCNNMWLREKLCDTSVNPEYHEFTGISCADNCCRYHDRCCSQDIQLQHNCNKEIVSCLSQCNHLSLTCTYDGIPTPAGVIELAMNVVHNWCCGTPCNK